MSKFELKQLLTKVYDVDVAKVNTINYLGEFKCGFSVIRFFALHCCGRASLGCDSLACFMVVDSSFSQSTRPGDTACCAHSMFLLWASLIAICRTLIAGKQKRWQGRHVYKEKVR